MLYMPLFYFLVSSACKTSIPGLVSDAVELYTHQFYTCSAKMSFNQGLAFSVHDFIHASASTPSMLWVYAFTLMQLISSHAFLNLSIITCILNFS
jgi:hypothetical protein